MKVILLERVEGRGGLGEIVTVKDGYARNFLLPRRKALRATTANMKVFEAQRATIEARNAEARADAAKAASSTGRSPAVTSPTSSTPKAARSSVRWWCWTSPSRPWACMP